MGFLEFLGASAWIVITLIAVVILVGNEWFYAPFWILLATLIGLQVFTQYKLFTLIAHHPLALVIYGLIYFAIGFVWSFGKWYLYLHDELDRIEKSRLLNTKERVEGAVPTFAENKQRLIMWATYWPFSIIYSLLDDIVRRLYSALMRHFEKVYNKIAAWVFKPILAKMANLPTEAEYEAQQQRERENNRRAS